MTQPRNMTTGYGAGVTFGSPAQQAPAARGVNNGIPPSDYQRQSLGSRTYQPYPGYRGR